MKKIKIISILLVVFLLSTIISPVVIAVSEETVTLTIAGFRDYDFARAVFELTNIERAKEGLSVLCYDSVLSEAAMKRAEEIALNFSHTRPNGENWYTVTSKANGENIALGYETPQSVIKGWMNSEGHRGNILDIKNYGFKSIGIGCYFLKDTFYWVQLFSVSPANEEPTETGRTEVYETEVEVSVSKLGNIIAEFSKRDLTIKVGETLEVSQVYVENCAFKDQGYGYVPIEKNNVIFTTSSDRIATIDNNGVICAYSEGLVDINIIVGDNIVTYTVTVLPNESENLNDNIDNEENNNEDDNTKIEDNNQESNANNNQEDNNDEVEEEIKTSKLEIITDEFGTYIKGDLNGDNMVNSLDASIALDIFKNGGATEEQIRRGDMNGDNMINSIDASMILDIFKSL